MARKHYRSREQTGRNRKIDERTLDGALLIVLRGEIELENAGSFLFRLDAALERGERRLIVDLRRVEFVDSTVVNGLLRTANRMNRDGGAIALVASHNEHVTRVLDRAGVTRLVPVFDGAEEAAASLAGSRGG